MTHTFSILLCQKQGPSLPPGRAQAPEEQDGSPRLGESGEAKALADGTGAGGLKVRAKGQLGGHGRACSW